MGSCLGLFQVLSRMGLDGLDVDLVQFLDEQFPVLSIHDGLDRRTEHFHGIFLQDSFLIKLDSAVESGLSAE